MKLEIHHYHHFDGEADVLRAVHQLGEKIMSAISDFAAKQNAHNAAIADDLGAIKTKLDEQATLITTLQTSAGTLTAEDQATLDTLEANNAALQSQADSTAGKTPPAPPVENPS